MYYTCMCKNWNFNYHFIAYELVYADKENMMKLLETRKFLSLLPVIVHQMVSQRNITYITNNLMPVQWENINLIIL